MIILKNIFKLFFLFPIFLFCEDSIDLSDQKIPILDGQALNATDLYHIKNNLDSLIKNIKKKSFDSEIENEEITKTLNRLIFLKKNIEPYTFWWQSHPMIGMRLEKPFWPLKYPYMPHAFALWELAPSLGKDIDVFLIDTGIAAFTLDLKNFYKKHQDLQMIVDFSKASYNFTSHEEDILDPFEQLIEMLIKYTDSQYDNEEYLRANLPNWIKNYLKNSNVEDISNYICTYGKPLLWHKINKKNVLTEEGKRALREIIQGELGFKPKHILKKNYTLVDLKHPNNQRDIILEFLPTAPIFTQNVNSLDNENKESEFFSASYESGHGSHSAGIIGALLHSYKPDGNITKKIIENWLYTDSGMCGLAPCCHTIMIKGLRSDGYINNRKILIKGVGQAQRLKAKIINLSLKIDNKVDETESDIILLQKYLKKIPYVVVSSGNGIDENNIINNSIESYPARFPYIPFDVGSFSFRKNEDGTYYYPILNISQYEKNIGPKFVMPGQNILSCGIVPQQSENSMYVFMQGTSTSAPMISGFMGLILADFSHVFLKKHEREIFLKACYSSAFKLHNDLDWNTKCLLGVLDMRTTLFVLHVLKSLKTCFYKNKKDNQKFSFYENIDKYIGAIHYILMNDINEYLKEKNLSKKSNFKKGFIDFFNIIKNENKNNFIKKDRFSSLNSAINYVTNLILNTLNNFDKNNKTHKALMKIFNSENYNCLNEYSDSIKKRISLVFDY